MHIDRHIDSGLVLVTGATGKVGRVFLERFLANARFVHFRVRALCNQRSLSAHDRLEVFRGSIEDRGTVLDATAGVTRPRPAVARRHTAK